MNDITVFFWAFIGLVVGLMLGRIAFAIFDIYRMDKAERERDAEQAKIKADIAAYNAKSEAHKAKNIRPHTPFIIQAWDGLQAKENPPDRLLCIMQDFFAELKHREANNDKAD